MVYHNVEDIDVEKINARIKDAIKEWGSQDDFFEGIPYSKQAFHKCVREKSLVSLSVLLEIAKKLNISVNTTKVHVCSILQKLSVDDRTQAAVKALKENITG